MREGAQETGFFRCGPDGAVELLLTHDSGYVEVWVGVLEQLDPQLDQADARIKAHATFGLINSTPHSANPASPARARRVLRDMTLAALRTH